MLSTTGCPEFTQKSLKIKQDDKFFSRLVSKETSTANPSFRVYYGNSSSVPFTWEIQPGTPKNNFSDNSVPPLTPPPSYYISNPDHIPKRRKYYQRSKLYKLLLNINFIKKGHVASSSLSSSLSSSSWSSSMSSRLPSSKGYRSKRHRFTSFSSSFDDGHVYGEGSPDSVMCFGKNHNKSIDSNGGGSAYTVVLMKRAFLSILGRRSV